MPDVTPVIDQLDVTPVIDQALVNMLRSSLRFQDPLIETDPVYTYTDYDLWEILLLVTPIYNKKYSAHSIPDEEKHLVLLLARKEVYWRLATSTAPYYPLEAEGAKLRKDVRFDHYVKLIQLTQEEFDRQLALFNSPGVVDSYSASITSPNYYQRNYNLSDLPEISLFIRDITPTSISFEWTKFSAKKGAFGCYKVYIDTSPVIDEYAENDIIPSTAKFVTYDVNKLKYRINNLKSKTTYYIAVLAINVNGTYGYATATVTTL